jgi:anti-sigma factor RsiW
MRTECQTGRQLAAYLEGALGAEARCEVEAHLDGCPPCREQAEGLRRVHDLLVGIACPSEEVLLLASLQRDPPGPEVAAHLARCPHCREAVAALAEARDIEAAVSPPPEGFERVLAQLRPPLEVPLSQVPAEQGAPPLLMQQQLDEIAVALQFSGQYSGLTVAVALRTAAAGPLAGVLVRATREDGKERAEVLTGAEGVATLTLRALRPARYVIEVEAEDTRAFVLDVTR